MSDNNTSTLQSVVDKASGAAQSAWGAITGSTADQTQGDRKQAEAATKSDLSHAGASVGGYSISASGVAKNDPARTDGQWNQTVGAGKETLGGLLGAEGLKQDGIAQNRAGKEQEAAGQLNDLGRGVGDRIAGSVGGAVAGLTGDREEVERRRAQHDEGKTAQRGVEAELQKQAEKQQQQQQQ